MAVTVDELEAFTSGRLSAAADESQRLLDAAYDIARGYCGWPVTLTTDEQVELTGGWQRILSLPTMNLLDVTAVTEDGVVLDVADLDWSRTGRLWKRAAYARWAGRVLVTMTHGYASTPGFDQAVLKIAAAESSTTRDDPSMLEKQVGSVRYRWSDQQVETVTGGYLLSRYRILPV